MKYAFPNDYGVECRDVVIDAAMLPIVRGKLLELLQPSIWATYGDFLLGYQAVARILQAMACSSPAAEAADRLYRLLDNIYNGTVYTVDGLGVVSPPIPSVPALPVGFTSGFRQQSLAAQGEIPAGIFGLFPRPATMADVIQTTKAAQPAELTAFDDALVALQGSSEAATIISTVRGFLGTAGQLSEGGGILLVSLLGTLANTAAQGLAAGQMDSLLAQMAAQQASMDLAVANLQAAVSHLNTLNVTMTGPGEYTPPTPVVSSLASIITLLQQQGSGDTAILQGIADALGTTADCVTHETVIGLLCRLNGYIGGALPPGDVPPGVCPGYESQISYGPGLLVRGTIDGSPTAYAYTEDVDFWVTAGFQWNAFLSYPNAAASDNVGYAQLPAASLPLNVCITVQWTGPLNGISFERYVGPGNWAQITSLRSIESAPGFSSSIVTFNTVDYYRISAFIPLAAETQVAYWITPSGIG